MGTASRLPLGKFYCLGIPESEVRGIKDGTIPRCEAIPYPIQIYRIDGREGFFGLYHEKPAVEEIEPVLAWLWDRASGRIRVVRLWKCTDEFVLCLLADYADDFSDEVPF